MSEKTTTFEKIRQSYDNLKDKPEKAILVGFAALLLFVGHDQYSEFQNEAIRRNPPEGSVCTIIDDVDDLQYEADLWFEGVEDIVLGKKNIDKVYRRNMIPAVSPSDQPKGTVTDYAICDYPGKPYADGGVRRVVNPDNIDQTIVKVIPQSEFPESPTVS